MSATSYAPACPSAKSTDEIPLALGVKLGFIKDNRFLFDYEHSKIIYDRCLDHIATCQLSARCLRVFNTILRQTIGFGKVEDHATTTRLEQLTKIRHDHVGNTLRYLAKRNIIKWRKGGKYNNYLSINYDFASWGERNPQKQNPNNDPTILLPDYYTKTPIDQGLCFDDEPEDVTQATRENVNTPEPDSAQYLDKDSVIQVVSDIVDDKFTQIKQLFTDNNQTKNQADLQTQQPEASIEAADRINHRQWEQYQDEIKAYQREIAALKQQSEHEMTQVKQQSEQELIYVKQQSEQKMTELKQQSEQKIIEIKQHAEQIALENSRLHKKQMDTHIQNQAPHVINEHYLSQDHLTTPPLEGIDYPVQLSEHECIRAKKVLRKSAKQAQAILDLLAIRLNQAQPALKNPIAYLARLVQKEQKNELDFSALQTFVRPQVIQRDLQELIIVHNRDYGQYLAYGEAVESYDFQPDDPDNVAELRRMEDIYSESFDLAQDSYNVLKAYIAEFQLDKDILKQLDSYGSAST